MGPVEPERLQKYLARAGVGSRRFCESLILSGRVGVDGAAVSVLGTKVLPGAAVVTVDGKPVAAAACDRAANDIAADGIAADGSAANGRAANGGYEDGNAQIYIMLNKPVGVITSAKDQFGRKTVLDLLPVASFGRVYPVGRLDYHTEGLLLLTNDGDFTNRVTHPRGGVEKTYAVTTREPLGEPDLKILRGGVPLDGGFVTSEARVFHDKSKPLVTHIVIHEGKNRQVRRMFAALGYTVVRLRRTAIGALTLGSLKAGEWRKISNAEAARVFCRGGP